MRRLLSSAAIASVALQGCTAITKDLRHPGGYPGHLLDKRTFDASESKQVQLLRFTLILAMAARMSGETVKTSTHADAVAKHLGAAADEINYAAANLYPAVEGRSGPPCAVSTVAAYPPVKGATDQIVSPTNALNAARADAQAAAARADQAANRAEAADQAVRQGIQDRTVTIIAGTVPPVVPTLPAADPPCDGYFVNFEADVPLIEYPMINLILATLPRDQLKDFAADLEKGNFLGGAFGLLKVIFVGVKGLHTAAGTYRTGQEALVANGADCSRLANGGRFTQSTDTVKQAVACLGLPTDSLFGPHPDEIKGDKLSRTISRDTFHALMFVARTSCVRLPIGSGDNSEEEVKELRIARGKLCQKLRFKPDRRRDVIEVRP